MQATLFLTNNVSPQKNLNHHSLSNKRLSWILFYNIMLYFTFAIKGLFIRGKINHGLIWPRLTQDDNRTISTSKAYIRCKLLT